MTSLSKYINEKLIINKNYNSYQYYPTTWIDLRKIIEQRYEELGAGTEQEPIDFNNIDVSGMDTFYNASKRQGIFEGTRFEYIDISDWNISNDISFMFCNCNILKSVGDLSNWNLLKVNSMHGMFQNCHELKSIGDLSKWKISNVEDMRYMFDGSGIKNIPSWYKG